MTRTTRLTLDADGQLRHRIPPGELSNDLAGWIADDLVAPGLIPPNAFERTFVSVVGDAWLPFYRNTLRELACGGAPGGTNAGMAPVHDRAADLARGSVVELGCCFGFLSLRLARDGRQVTAVDVSPARSRSSPRSRLRWARHCTPSPGTRPRYRWPTAAPTPCSPCTSSSTCRPRSRQR